MRVPRLRCPGSPKTRRTKKNPKETQDHTLTQTKDFVRLDALLCLGLEDTDVHVFLLKEVSL